MDCLFNQSLSCDALANYSYIAWFLFGILLIGIEFLIPGIFVVFFGIGALVTAFAQYAFGLGMGMQLTIWISSSLLVMFVGAKFLHDLFPSDKKVDPSNFKIVEGKLALVIKDVKVNKKGGRIHFQGTDWDAISEDVEIPAGEYAKILSRENIHYRVIKPLATEVEQFLESRKKTEEE